MNSEPFFNFFDADYHPLNIQQGHPRSEDIPSKPLRFDEMKIIASKLSKGLSQVRIDLYEVNGKVYFGEITFFHFAGVVPFNPNDWDYKFGEMIRLPLNN